MKKIILFLFVIILFNGCEENLLPEITELNYSPMSGPGGTEFTLSVQASDGDGDDLIYLWISDEGEFPEGNYSSQVKWKSPETDTDKVYPIEVMISDGKEIVKDTLQISVEAVEIPVLSVSPESQSVTNSSGSAVFQVSNTGEGTMEWSAEVTSGSGWARITSGSSGSNSGTINVEYDGNQDNSERTAEITVTASGATGSPTTVTIVQAGQDPVLAVSPDSRSVSSSTGSTSFDVSNSGGGTVDWNASVTSGSDWARITSGSSGSNSGTINVEYDENMNNSERTAEITVNASGAAGSPKTVTVVQAGAESVLLVSPDSRSVTYSSGSTSFDVSNGGGGNMDWSAAVTIGSDWVRISSGSSGSNSGTINIEYDENTGKDERTAIITVTASGATGSPKTVTVLQAGTDPVLVVSPDSQSVTSSAGSTSFNVSNSGGGTMAWSAIVTSGSNWARITSGSSGSNSGTVNVEYDENTGNDERTAVITVIASGSSGSPKLVSVIQAGKNPVLLVTPESQNVSYSSGSTSFEVSNGGGGTMVWSAELTSGSSWAQISSGSSGSNSGTINVEYVDNEGNSARTAEITVTATGAGGSPKTVTVIQAGKDPVLMVSPESQSVAYTAGNTSFDVSNSGGGTMAWTAEVTSGGSWARISSGSSGSNSGTISIEYDVNQGDSERTAEITVTAPGAGGSPEVVTIEQAGQSPVLLVSPDSRSVTSSSGNTSFNVSNSGGGTMAWSAEITSSGSWARITSGSSGSNSGTINVEYDENQDSSQRTAQITVTASGAGGSPKTVTVVQAGAEPVLVVSPDSQSVSSSSGNTSFDVSNSGGGTMIWSASVTSGGSWVQITSGSSGSNSGTISVDYSENTGEAVRTAEITVRAAGAGGSPKTVTVIQSGKESVLLVTPETYSVDYHSGNASFEVYNQGGGTMAWSAVVTGGSSWARISSGSSGSNYGTIQVEYDENPVNEARTAEITVTAPGASGSPKTVTIVQDAIVTVLVVTPESQSVSAQSGNTNFSVSNTGAGDMAWSAEVTSGRNWARITSGSSGTNSGTIAVSYDENPDNTPREATITVTAAGASGSPKIVTIEQAASSYVLVVTPDTRSVGYASGSTTFSVSNSGGGTMNWSTSVISGSSWAHISSGSSGSNSGTITINYDENTGDERTASIMVTASGASGSPKTVTVVQAGQNPVLAVTPDTRSVGYQQGSTTFSVSNTGAGSMNWSASVTGGGSWARISSGNNGTNSGTITVGYDDNQDNTQRTAQITVTASGADGSPKTVTVVQAAGTGTQVFTDSRDNRQYEYKVIGSQSWMIENLAYLPSVNAPSSVSETSPRYYVYNHWNTDVSAAKSNSNYNQFGVLYNIPAAKTACPSGWHLPSYAEWSTLTSYLENNGYGYEGSGNDIAKSMAAGSVWKSSSTPGTVGNDLGTNNRSGFSALPGGYMYHDNPATAFYYGNEWAVFWTASQDVTYYHKLDLRNNRSTVTGGSQSPADGMSVRCIKD